MKNTITLLNDMANSGGLKPILGKSYNLQDVQKAHYEIINNSGSLGKTFFIIN